MDPPWREVADMAFDDVVSVLAAHGLRPQVLKPAELSEVERDCSGAEPAGG